MTLFFETREVEALSALPSFGASLRFPVTRNQTQYSHWLFNRYPARSIAEVPRCLIMATSRQLESPRIKVLDPFAGSGTTAVETLLAGGEAYGVEADPFARLIATVRTTVLTKKEFATLEKVARSVTKFLKRATSPATSYFPDIPNLEYWFPAKNIRDLAALRRVIEKAVPDGKIRNFLLVVLADLVRPCSYAERQTLKPYISKRFPKQPATVQDAWEKHFGRDLAALQEFSARVGSDA